jgi:hypothetical protein
LRIDRTAFHHPEYVNKLIDRSAYFSRSVPRVGR